MKLNTQIMEKLEFCQAVLLNVKVAGVFDQILLNKVFQIIVRDKSIGQACLKKHILLMMLRKLIDSSSNALGVREQRASLGSFNLFISLVNQNPSRAAPFILREAEDLVTLFDNVCRVSFEIKQFQPLINFYLLFSKIVEFKQNIN